jgi:hypothetical protein
MCVLIFSTSLSEIFLILKRSELDIIIKVSTAVRHVKYELFLSDFNETWIFSTDFRKILKYQISLTSLQLLHADGRKYRQTDYLKTTKENVVWSSP